MGKQRRLRAAKRAEQRAAEIRALLKPTITPNHARALEACSRGDAATAMRLLEMEPSDAPSYLLARGMIAGLLVTLGRWSEAERAAAEVVELGNKLDERGKLLPPQLVTTARYHAESVSVQGRDSEASTLFRAAVDLAQRCAVAVQGEHEALTAWYELELAAVLTSWGTTATHMHEYDAACELLRDARTIYLHHETTRPSELSACLANYGEALRLADRPYDAEMALLEALETARTAVDEPLAVRILGVLGRMGSKHFNPIHDFARIVRDAEAAQSSGRFSAAYVRWCICAEIATCNGDYSAAVDAIESAMAIEPNLDPTDLNPAKLRIDHARILQKCGAPNDAIVSKLVEGARLWFDRLARPF